MTNRRLAATRASAAWAAWGDALGFITELTDESGLRHRAGVDHVVEPVPWRRRVGGRMGVEARLPAGAYSDDTQLRLATSRSIRSDGEFDVDSFARVELVAWQAYHLGAGRGSKAAAAGMSRSDATWNANVFSTKDVKYVEVGGNGAAMRIQPHVWSAPDLADPRTVLNRVMRDAVSSHGHPVALVGAALHAVSLMITLERDQVPGPAAWGQVTDLLRSLPSVFEADSELGGLWVAAWEQAAGRPFVSALTQTLDHACDLLAAVGDRLETGPSDPNTAYRDVLNVVGGLDPATRGSGVGTAIAALALAAMAEDPEAALRLAANTLGSDTDTIATMAGALVGAVVGDRPPTPPQDHAYIDREASRMHAIATGRGNAAQSYRYPDLLSWTPPRSALDLVGLTTNGELALAGHGVVTADGELRRGGGTRTPTIYQWMQLPTGQHVYLRFRSDPKPLPPGLLPPPAAPPPAPAAPGSGHTLVPGASRQDTLPMHLERAVSVDEALRWVGSRGYAPQALGQALLDVIRADPAQAVGRAAAFASVVAREVVGQPASREAQRTGTTGPAARRDGS